MTPSSLIWQNFATELSNSLWNAGNRCSQVVLDSGCLQNHKDPVLGRQRSSLASWKEGQPFCLAVIRVWTTLKCRGSLLEARRSEWSHLNEDFCSVLDATLKSGVVCTFLYQQSHFYCYFNWKVQRYFVIQLSGKLLLICFSSEVILRSSFQFWASKTASLKNFPRISPFFQLSINIYSIILVALLCISVGPSHVWSSYQ